MASVRSSAQLLCKYRAPLRLATPGSLRPQAQRLQLAPRRFLNTDTAPVLASSHAKVIGAREGHIDGDGLEVDLTMPKALGGAGEAGKTNPEELFAAGYGACFQSAMNASAMGLKINMPKKPEDSIVETTVHLVGDMKQLDLGIRVDMKVKVKGMKKEDIDKVVAKAKEVCPYSRATKGNVTTSVEVIAS